MSVIRTTIDGVGRIVIPKAVRDRLALRGGDEVEVDAVADRIESRRPGRDEALVERDDGLRSMASGPGLGPDEVRDLLERQRR